MEKLNKIMLVGIDYSINSPAMSIYAGDLDKDKFELDNLNFFAFVKSKNIKANEFISINDFEWDNYIQRWKSIAYEFLCQIQDEYIKKNVLRENVYVVIEGYSFGSNRNKLNRSLIFNIAENTAILKYVFYDKFIKYKIYQPTSIKKFITGNGLAKKELVYEKICERLNIDLSEYLKIQLNKKIPIYDFSDSLSILFMTYCEMLIKNNLHYKGIFNISDEEIEFFKKENKQGYSILEENFIFKREKDDDIQ